MLEPKNDRLDYGKMLIPNLNSDWELELAVATTYSLDLQTLVASCISLGLFESAGSELLNNPISLLRAVLKVSDKLVVFCESGQIPNPSKSSKLHLLLENVIVPIALKKTNNGYPSFHPKTWTLIFKDKKGHHFARFITLSRNMTFDRSWDVSLVLDGKEEKGGKTKVKPLIDFMEFLRGHITKDIDRNKHKRRLLRNAINILDNIRFETDDKTFSDFKIEPIGIGAFDICKDNDEPLMSINYNDIMIFSPFLSADVVRNFAQLEESAGWKRNTQLKNCRRMLITRKSALEDKDIIEILRQSNFEVWVLKDDVVYGENMTDEGDTGSPKLEDIHAKMYLYRKYSQVYFYMGSMNATFNGLKRNVEMMVRLTANNRYFNYDVLRNDLFGDEKDNPFEHVDLNKYVVMEPSEEEKEKTALKLCQQNTIKWICRHIPAIDLIEGSDGKYSLKLTFSKLEEIEKEIAITETSLNGPNHVSISPITIEGWGKPLEKVIEFTPLSLDKLTTLFKVTVFCHGIDPMTKIIVIPYNIPEQRNENIVRKIIKDNGFLNYVSFVLGDDPIESISEIMDGKKQNAIGSSNSNNDNSSTIYESMLTSAYDNPSKLREVARMRDMLGDSKDVPEQFDKLYKVFKGTLKL